jgi:siroheme synthase-like protein
MRFYPINLKIANRKCVIVGGGRVAERKVRRLLAFGGKVTLISPDLTVGLERLIQKKRIKHIRKKYWQGAIRNAFLVFAATSDRKVNQKIALEAKKLDIPVNVADSVKESTFILPAIYKRRNVTISVSTDGKSPSLAKKIRNQLKKLICSPSQK